VQGESGLAAAAGAGERQQSGGGEQAAHLFGIGVPAEQWGRLAGKRGHG
jgi:hypothetical protein